MSCGRNQEYKDNDALTSNSEVEKTMEPLPLDKGGGGRQNGCSAARACMGRTTGGVCLLALHQGLLGCMMILVKPVGHW